MDTDGGDVVSTSHLALIMSELFFGGAIDHAIFAGERRQETLLVFVSASEGIG